MRHWQLADEKIAANNSSGNRAAYIFNAVVPPPVPACKKKIKKNIYIEIFPEKCTHHLRFLVFKL